MFLFGRKSDSEKFAQGNDFLKSYATKIRSLMNYTAQNEKVTDELNRLKEAYVFAVSPRMNKEVKKYQANIEKMFEELRNVLKQNDWDERDVMIRIADLKSELEMLTSIRR
jgi:hypothetical protein